MTLKARSFSSLWSAFAIAGIFSLSKHRGVDSYAAWLKCFVELDPSEVIMNQYVVPFRNAEYDGIELEVRKEGEENEWTSKEYFHSEAHTIEVRLRLPQNVKKSFDEARREVQWVLEATPGATVTSSELCDGRRGYAMRHDEVITLEIDSNKTISEKPVELVAGWAFGHSEVTLTPRMSLRLRMATNAEEL